MWECEDECKDECEDEDVYKDEYERVGQAEDEEMSVRVSAG